MTATQAANLYLALCASGDIRAAICVAHNFEANATEESFDEYLALIEASL